ncbi:DUF2785 domain-containing protein [Micromonospora auratinigra]|uniref:DUF2785 domain-containing protein n=1 Tax=Micromonospora auratinigra TaxID=261654 RepID=A0A1A8ZB74_9ACTN|nr:DUF2785 domain-containing protein [Micromonospora auratinigra]SBT41224.1 Protein of unknown function (DUF2785) [Micromonospora auratinigra]
MTDWDLVHDTGCAVPVGRPLDDLVAELATALRDPDPAVRDGAPYVVLRTWIAEDVIDAGRRAKLGAEMAARFTDPEIQARTFAPLVLDMIVSRGDFDPAWLAAFTDWYPTETDLRGYDQRLGWLHAVAHGADLLATFGRHPRVDPAAMLDLAAARLVAPTDQLFAEQEDDRLARAIALVLARPGLTERDALAWLDRIAADYATKPRGATPAHLANSMRTLHALYLLMDLGIGIVPRGTPLAQPHRDAVKARLIEVLAPVFQHA